MGEFEKYYLYLGGLSSKHYMEEGGGNHDSLVGYHTFWIFSQW